MSEFSTTTSDKFGRNYELYIETNYGQRDENGEFILDADGVTQVNRTLTISLPFTIEFDITRNTLTSCNVCQIRVYNLSKINRNQIHFNAYDAGTFRKISLRAGYGSNLATLFQGNMTQAWSVREGVDFVTQIECYDGGFAFVNGTVDISFPAGTTMRNVIRTIMGYLPNVSVGTVGNFTGSLQRANTYSGNPAQLLYEITGGGFFIDNGIAHALLTNEYIPDQLNQATLIGPQTGLLGTPVLENTTARFEMLFEPTLNVGRLVKLESTTNEIFDQLYKITSIKHRGMISGVVAGNAVTMGEFFYSKKPVPAR